MGQGFSEMAARLGKAMADFEFLAQLVMQIGVIRMGDQGLLQQRLVAALLAFELLIFIAIMADQNVEFAPWLRVYGLFMHRPHKLHTFGQEARQPTR